MKTKILTLLAAAVLACGLLTAPLALTGCGTPVNKVNQAVSATTTTVDAAMNSWGGWVRAGKATKEDERKVREAYVKYQAAMGAAETLTIAALNAPEGQPALTKAISATSAASAELIALIAELTK
jgi:hypothetical protein